MSNIRARTIQGLKAGDTFRVTRTFCEEDVFRFADITRDYNPIHFDDRFAGTKKLNGRICHGLLVGSLLTEIGGQIGWLASRMNFRFKGPVFLGDTVTCTLRITEIDSENRAQASAQFANQQGSVVLEAELGGILPGEPELEVLKAIISDGDPTNKVQ